MIHEPKRCPIRYGMGVFGDRWSLIIIRDMTFNGSTRFQDFLRAPEGIATNVLADRLSRLETQQIISRQKDPTDGRQVLYQLTDKGKDLLPILLAIMGWAEKYDPKTSLLSNMGERIRTDLSAVRNEILTAMEHSDSSRVSQLLFGEPEV